MLHCQPIIAAGLGWDRRARLARDLGATGARDQTLSWHKANIKRTLCVSDNVRVCLLAKSLWLSYLTMISRIMEVIYGRCKKAALKTNDFNFSSHSKESLQKRTLFVRPRRSR